MAMTAKEAETLIAAQQVEDASWVLVKRRVVITGLAVLLIGAGAGWVAIETVVQPAARYTRARAPGRWLSKPAPSTSDFMRSRPTLQPDD